MGGFMPAVDAGGAESKYPESRVLVIITGGTICMQPSAKGLVPVEGFLENAMATRPSFNDMSERVPLSVIKDGARITIDSLRTPPSSYSKHIRYGALEFSPLLDSSSISSAGWAQIADAIKANYHLFDGFVVLHGTDSLAYSASALSFMLEDLGKPVILTGSQASIFSLQSDAVENLLGSLIVAGTFVIPEVCLFFHHTLFRGNRTTKVSASSFEAFASPNCDPLARVTGLGIDVNWQLVRRPTRLARFVDARTTHLDTAHVACVRVFPGIKPRMVDSVLRVPNLRGLIIETFGMGNAPSVSSGGGSDSPAEESLLSVIRAAVERGVTVVNVSQCAHGLVSPLYAPGFALGAAGVVFGHDLTSEAALTKLSYLLAAEPPLAQAEVAELMARDLRGEMTERRVPSFTHPAARSLSFSLGPAREPGVLGGGGGGGVGGRGRSPISAADAAFTALGWAIRDADVDAVRDMLEGDEVGYQLLKRADYAGNTAVHLAALAVAGPDPPPPPPPQQQQRGDDGTTATSTRSSHTAADVLKELLVRGASVHARNRANNTPLFLAQQAGNAECVALLKEAGAVLWEDEVLTAK
ncbi:hypothetical protein DL764_007143 [Monosporascus ibericus]|uniref:asparaginase n=1 Tax=Monosporascus ibericus TaxID=155417 RepID=A0A4Q4T650_9PEZI|nr:hypothetical protein DL764_007143 [Monosporascus ibericus]